MLSCLAFLQNALSYRLSSCLEGCRMRTDLKTLLER